MNLYRVTIRRAPHTDRVTVRARSHEEAEREALLVVGEDYQDVEWIIATPVEERNDATAKRD